jgi:hypothetical protein
MFLVQVCMPFRIHRFVAAPLLKSDSGTVRLFGLKTTLQNLFHSYLSIICSLDRLYAAPLRPCMPPSPRCVPPPSPLHAPPSAAVLVSCELSSVTGSKGTVALQYIGLPESDLLCRMKSRSSGEENPQPNYDDYINVLPDFLCQLFFDSH